MVSYIIMFPFFNDWHPLPVIAMKIVLVQTCTQCYLNSYPHALLTWLQEKSSWLISWQHLKQRHLTIFIPFLLMESYHVDKNSTSLKSVRTVSSLYNHVRSVWTKNWHQVHVCTWTIFIIVWSGIVLLWEVHTYVQCLHCMTRIGILLEVTSSSMSAPELSPH